MKIEVGIKKTKWGYIHIVKERTDSDRFEMTVEEAELISQAKHLFDGEIIDLYKTPGVKIDPNIRPEE